MSVEMFKLFLVGFFVLSFVGYIEAQKKIVCYVGTWAIYRNGHGKFDVGEVDPFLCTHLMYGFFGVHDDGTVRVIDPYLDLSDNWGRGNIQKFNDLKKANPSLKTLAAIGGWNEGSRKFSHIAANPALRKVFVADAINFCLKYGFDGVDLDWEYPAQRDGDPKIDKENHSVFLAELRYMFSQYNLLLTAAVASAEFSASLSYDIPKVAKYLDFINVMTYDLHGAWDHAIGLNSPMYAGPMDVTSTQKQLNVNASIHYWLSQGAPREKIILGIPLYGRSFSLAHQAENTIGSAHNGAGQGGPYTHEPGMIGYNELCEKLMTEQWNMRWSEEQAAPYAFKGNQWIGYDDMISIQLKVKYLMDLDLGGAMVWSLETDDFRGICGAGKYPLMRTIKSVINNGPLPSPPTTITTIVTPAHSSSIPTSTGVTMKEPSGVCAESGIYANLDSCNKYHICENFRKYEFTCPAGLLFDPALMVCNWPYHVDCQ